MKVALLLSGGVDSSVSLGLILEKAKKLSINIQIKAFYLKVWLQDEFTSLGNCPWEEDISYAEQVCKIFQVPFEVISLQNEYWNQVVTYAIKEIKKGHTPNPDIFCNSAIKFGEFVKKIPTEYDFIASGHYAQIVRDHNQVQLKMSSDGIKDQTYFLSYLTKEQLSKCLFPLGDKHLDKNEVRELAKKYNLPNKNRKDSQGVCFLGKIKFRDFIAFHLGKKKGKIIERKTGIFLGTHQGYWFYTLGQRQGLNLSGGPWYVVEKDIDKNIVYVCHADEFNENIFFNINQSSISIKIYQVNWLEKNPLEDYFQTGQPNLEFKVKLRHGQNMHPFIITEMNTNQLTLEIQLTGQLPNQINLGGAPGQFAVLYKNDICLASGIIRL